MAAPALPKNPILAFLDTWPGRVTAVAGAILILWQLYDRVLAPPPEISVQVSPVGLAQESEAAFNRRKGSFSPSQADGWTFIFSVQVKGLEGKSCAFAARTFDADTVRATVYMYPGLLLPRLVTSSNNAMRIESPSHSAQSAVWVLAPEEPGRYFIEVTARCGTESPVVAYSTAFQMQ